MAIILGKNRQNLPCNDLGLALFLLRFMIIFSLGHDEYFCLEGTRARASLVRKDRIIARQTVALRRR